MKKNAKMIGKIAGFGLAGVAAFGASNAMAETFNVTAEVQNTLAITITQEMNLGTLYAVSASSGQIGQLIISTSGGTTAGTQDIPLIALGGQTQAIGTVNTDANFNVVVPTGTYASLGDASANGEQVEIAGGDPAVADFYLTDFTVGDGVDGVVTQANPGDVAAVNPDFGATAVSFGIGATINTDDSGSAVEYQAGTYTGTFTVTAEF